MECIHTLHEDILVSELRDRSTFVKLEVIKAAGSLDGPLLLGAWCHFGIDSLF